MSDQIGGAHAKLSLLDYGGLLESIQKLGNSAAESFRIVLGDNCRHAEQLGGLCEPTARFDHMTKARDMLSELFLHVA